MPKDTSWFMIEKESGACISCIKKIPDDPKGIVIVVHGFTSCKESMTGAVLMEHLPSAGLGVVAYDQPGHGTDVARFEELRVANCVDSLAEVEKAVTEMYPDVPLYYFGSSYGAYITALYTATRPHRGVRAVFRSAAVNMPSIMLGDDLGGPAPAIKADLEKNGYTEPDLGLSGTVRIPAGFFEDMRGTDLFETVRTARDKVLARKAKAIAGDDPAAGTIGGTRILMIHALGDEVVAYEAAERFSKEFGIELISFEGEHHTLSDHKETPDRIAALALEFFTAG